MLLLILLVLIVLGYTNNWSWTGLHGRTLYDWLQLLIIPAVLALGGYLFNYTTGRTEREIASDKQREDALQAYIDKMSVLLLENDLSKPVELEKVRKIGRVRTLTVLRRLDEERKASVLQFLYESGLIDKATKIIDLSDADLSHANLMFAELSKADLRKANLFGANLGETNLTEADLNSAILVSASLFQANMFGANLYKAWLRGAKLFYADLSGADLTGANLMRANLIEANLRGANLDRAYLYDADLSGADLKDAINITTEQLDKAKSLKGATMPNGTKHA